jgi:hypothetical protein
MKPVKKQTKAASAGAGNDRDNRATLSFLKKSSSLYVISFLLLATVVVGFVGTTCAQQWRRACAGLLNPPAS